MATKIRITYNNGSPDRTFRTIGAACDHLGLSAGLFNKILLGQSTNEEWTAACFTEDVPEKGLSDTEVELLREGFIQVFVKPEDKDDFARDLKKAFPGDPTISFLESNSPHYIAALNDRFWKTSVTQFKEPKVVKF